MKRSDSGREAAAFRDLAQRADPRLAQRATGRRAIPGLEAAGVGPDDILDDEIRGSTTILELLRMFPDGRAARLMSEIQFPCAHCGGAVREPLTLAAKRHKRDPRAVLDAFRALGTGFPDDELVREARSRVPPW